MSARQRRILFWVLFLCVLGLAGVLVVERQRARDRVRDLRPRNGTADRFTH